MPVSANASMTYGARWTFFIPLAAAAFAVSASSAKADDQSAPADAPTGMKLERKWCMASPPMVDNEREEIGPPPHMSLYWVPTAPAAFRMGVQRATSLLTRLARASGERPALSGS